MSARRQEVGAPDPELRTSPVAWETDEDVDSLRMAADEEPECLFNNRAFPDGSVVTSGGTPLRCDRSIRVPAEKP